MEQSTKVGIVCPCSIEYNKCKKILGLNNEKQVSGRKISLINKNNLEIYAIQAGVGKINSASATQLIIDEYNIDFVFDVGTSGSLSREINLYDIICCETAFEYDISLLNRNNLKMTENLILNTVIKNGTKKQKFKHFINKMENKKIYIKVGNIASGEKNVKENSFREKLKSKLNAIACNWETSAILRTSELNNKSSLSFRVITDFADDKMVKDFDKNWNQATEILFIVLKSFLFNNWLNHFK